MRRQAAWHQVEDEEVQVDFCLPLTANDVVEAAEAAEARPATEAPEAAEPFVFRPPFRPPATLEVLGVMEAGQAAKEFEENS